VIAESPTAPSRALAHARHRRRMDEGLLLQHMSPEMALFVAPLRRNNPSGAGGRADSSPTASKRRKSQRSSILAEPVSLGAGSRTGDATLGGHSAWQISQKHHPIVNYFFFPVTSSHFFPEVRFDFMHFHAGGVLHLQKHCACGSIRGGSITGIRSCTSATNLFGAYVGFSGDELSQ
jgi:hypothetical protein